MTIFEDLMNGLNEVDAFLAGEKRGFKVTVLAEVIVSPPAASVTVQPGWKSK